MAVTHSPHDGSGRANDPSMPGATFLQITGMILMREHKTYTPTGTPDYVWRVFAHVQKHNLLFGWWSVYALIMNPFLLVANTIAWWQYKSDFNVYTLSPDAYRERISKRAKRGSAFGKIFLYSILGFFGLLILLLLIAAIITG